jgi:hypothetical protein
MLDRAREVRLSECVNFLWERGGPRSAKPTCRELPSQTQFNSRGFQWSEILRSTATRPLERCRKLLAIGKDNLAEVHQRLAVLGWIADRGNFVAGL